MKLTAKLLAALNRPFEKSPDAFVGLRLSYISGLTWVVSDQVLTLSPAGGETITYDLTAYTLDALVSDISKRAGFGITFIDPERRHLAATVLMDGAGDLSVTNGDALLGYTSLLWAFLEAFAVQLQRLRDQVGQAILQMATTTAANSWLVELGSYYGVLPMVGESDELYSVRIIAETLRPVSNNVAIEKAIEDFTGQPCTVDDVVIYRTGQRYDGSVNYDGTIDYNALSPPNYGLFDVTIAYDLILGGDPTTFAATVEAIVNKLRAAGTFLRALALGSASTPLTDALSPPGDAFGSISVTSTLTDAFTAPADTFASLVVRNSDMADALAAPTESMSGSIFQSLTDEAGNPITDASASPIQVSLGPLFI